jgi:hypothetical protein
MRENPNFVELKMYPVLSMMRRLSAHHVYVDESLLENREGTMVLRLETESAVLDFSTGKWKKPADRVEMSVLVAKGSTPQMAAVTLAKFENEMADSIGAKDTIYTLVLGPELEEEVDHEVVRTLRVAVVRGIYRAIAGEMKQVKAKGTKEARFTRSRPGAIRM